MITLGTYIIIGAWAHFYFAFLYFFKRHGVLLLSWHVIFALIASVFLLWLLGVKLFFFLALFLFIFHNYFDLKKFGKVNQANFFLIYGLVVTAALYFFYGDVTKYLVWIVVVYHYLFWYFFFKHKDRKTKLLFFGHIIMVHILIFLVYLFFKDIKGVAFMYSSFMFHFMTMVHVIFSYTSKQQFAFLKSKNQP